MFLLPTMPRLTDSPGSTLPNIKDRFGVENFRRFEPAIIHLLSTFPRDCILNPGKLAQATAIARLRDAVRAYCHPDNTWPSLASRDNLRSIWEQCFIVPHGTTQVCIKSTASSANADLLEGLRTPSSVISDALVVDSTDHDLAHAVTVCKNRNFLTDQITFINLTEHHRDELTSLFPDSIWLDGDLPNSFILL